MVNVLRQLVWSRKWSGPYTTCSLRTFSLSHTKIQDLPSFLFLFKAGFWFISSSFFHFRMHMFDLWKCQSWGSRASGHDDDSRCLEEEGEWLMEEEVERWSSPGLEFVLSHSLQGRKHFSHLHLSPRRRGLFPFLSRCRGSRFLDFLFSPEK